MTSGFASFLRPGFFGQSVDHLDDLLDRSVRGLERLDGFLFGHLVGARFDHHDAVLRAGHHQVEAALLPLREGRVDDVLAIDQADAHRGDGLFDRHLRQRERRARAGERQDVGVVFGVGRKHERNDLGFERPSGGEERPDRPIDHAAGERFLFGGLAFALEEAAGNAARGIGVFAVVDGERKEVNSFALARGMARGDEHHGVAHADNHRAVGLLGQLAGLNRQGMGTER